VPEYVNPALAKAAVRTEVLAARRRMSRQQLAHSAARVQMVVREQIADLVWAAGSRPPVVTAYAPTGTEPGGADLPAVVRDAMGRDTMGRDTVTSAGRVLLPVLRADLDLDWAEFRGELGPAGRGLREPPGPRLGVDALTAATLLVIPAVAVDRRGVRLGRGGGSFDRALERAGRQAKVVALLHDGEWRDEDLPVEAHDRRVDAVVVPSAGLVLLP
jgi:5-formyltetrahydrofolate cyclo-ligase